MPELWQIVQWLSDGNEHEAALLLSEAELDYEYLETLFDISGEGEVDLWNAVIRLPRKALDSEERKSHSEAIEDAIRRCSQADQMYIRGVHWLAKLPKERDQPMVESVRVGLAALEMDHIHTAWQKALSRKSADPEGAITAARTLLESVCKSILDTCSVPYHDTIDLPKLYGLTARELRLAPDQHTEDVFKQILGGCFTVVNGLGTVRNRLSDAHGKGKAAVRPQERHAELAVNLAGAVATFLVATWTARRGAQ